MPEQARITLCIIARDEEDNLGRCLASARGAVDEIVVVDTGSQDATASVAASFGARVVHAPWTNDFASARNRSLAEASGDWLLWLDADDELSAEAREMLRPLVRIATPDVMGYQFVIASWVGDKSGGAQMCIAQTRLWRSRPEHRFHGAIHEWLAVDSVVATDLKIFHYGYLSDPRVQRRKSARNIGLLREQLRQNSEDARYIGYLAVELAVAGRLPQSLVHFRRSWSLARIHYVGERYARTLMTLRRFALARQVLEEAIDRFPDYTDLHYHYSCVLRELGEYGGARAAARRCLELGTPSGGYVSLEGYGSFLAHLQLALIEADLHNWGAAIEESQQALLGRPDLTLALSPLVKALIAVAGPSRARDLFSDESGVGPAMLRLLAREFAQVGAWAEALDLLRQAGTDGELPGDQLVGAECLLAQGDVRAGAERLAALQGKEFILNAARRRTSLVLSWITAWMRGDIAAAASLLQAARGRSRGATAALRALQDRLLGSDVALPALAESRLTLLELAEKTMLVGRWDLTEQVIELLKGYGDRVEVPAVIGRLLVRYGHADIAVPYLRDALAHWGRRRKALPRSGGDACDLWLDLGEAYLAASDWAEAARSFRQALALGPNRLEAHLGLAEAHLRRCQDLVPEGDRAAWADLAQEARLERFAALGAPAAQRPQTPSAAAGHRL